MYVRLGCMVESLQNWWQLNSQFVRSLYVLYGEWYTMSVQQRQRVFFQNLGTNKRHSGNNFCGISSGTSTIEWVLKQMHSFLFRYECKIMLAWIDLRNIHIHCWQIYPQQEYHIRCSVLNAKYYDDLWWMFLMKIMRTVAHPFYFLDFPHISHNSCSRFA